MRLDALSCRQIIGPMATKLREIAAPFSDDPDFEALQQAPTELIEVVADGKIGIAVCAYNGNTPEVGSCSIQPVLVERTSDPVITTAEFGAYVESGVPTGRLVIVDVRMGMKVGVRVWNASFGAATRAIVFWKRMA